MKRRACKYYKMFRTVMVPFQRLKSGEIVQWMPVTTLAPGVLVITHQRGYGSRNKWKQLRKEFKRSRRNGTKRERTVEAVREAL